MKWNILASLEGRRRLILLAMHLLLSEYRDSNLHRILVLTREGVNSPLLHTLLTLRQALVPLNKC